MRYLVTGGSGYLGTHLVYQLFASENEVVVFDDLSGHLNTKFPSPIKQIHGSIANPKDLAGLSNFGPFDGVFHLAAKKSVTESLSDPDMYWKVNKDGTANVLNLCSKFGIKRIVATSSAAVYGASTGPNLIDENDSVNPTNTYGETKAAAEVLINAASSSGEISSLLLRSFNLAGATKPEFFDKQGENVLPIIMRSIAEGLRFEIFGGSFETPDGTCVRDYVNVSDVADAHIKAMEYLMLSDIGIQDTANIASGEGVSVKELVGLI